MLTTAFTFPVGRHQLRRRGLLLVAALCAIVFLALAIEAGEPEVFFGALIYLLWTADLPRRWRWIGSSLAVVAILGIAYSRVYLNAHWLSDVLGGFTGGAAYLGFGITWIERRVSQGGSR